MLPISRKICNHEYNFRAKIQILKNSSEFLRQNWKMIFLAKITKLEFEKKNSVLRVLPLVMLSISRTQIERRRWFGISKPPTPTIIDCKMSNRQYCSNWTDQNAPVLLFTLWSKLNFQSENSFFFFFNFLRRKTWISIDSGMQF